jgi:hypothetical protein
MTPAPRNASSLSSVALGLVIQVKLGAAGAGVKGRLTLRLRAANAPCIQKP